MLYWEQWRVCISAYMDGWKRRGLGVSVCPLEKTSERDNMDRTDRTCVVLRTKSSVPVAEASGFRLMTGGRGGVKQETDSLNLQSWA